MRAGRRRLWRWAVTVWAVAVVVGGGLTLWLHDSGEPPEPYGWEETDGPSEPMPDWEDVCPSPGTTVTPQPGATFHLCAYTTTG
ncbi:hypothetical protein OHA71_18415 [Streptomyces sp. NBC_00444]|uniref:hypothetical protein n=1 Tax=Streptomyces sp. NBC_00444 TaxID=2975744 RepID=UPI002E1E1946